MPTCASESGSLWEIRGLSTPTMKLLVFQSIVSEAVRSLTYWLAADPPNRSRRKVPLIFPPPNVSGPL